MVGFFNFWEKDGMVRIELGFEGVILGEVGVKGGVLKIIFVC